MVIRLGHGRAMSDQCTGARGDTQSGLLALGDVRRVRLLSHIPVKSLFEILAERKNFNGEVLRMVFVGENEKRAPRFGRETQGDSPFYRTREPLTASNHRGH